MVFFDSFPPSFLDVVGVAGFASYVLTYTLLTIGCLRSDQIRYFAMNWLSASMVLVGLLGSFNLASALIQIFWIVMSTIGITLRLRRRARGAQFTTVRDKPFAATA